MAVDLCETPTLDSVMASLKRGVAPRGVVDAGVYTQDKNAHTMTDCIASCCSAPECEVQKLE
jgi:hypothetical protein